ncbi:MAG TPA: hypothetical protein ENI22_01420 [Candidatus Pacearchaeota archaeon]|nr:hypothetical protein [Candidatus Pacearchaeota archaeon]
MEQLEDNLDKHPTGIRNALIGLGIFALGNEFDYGKIDEIVRIAGGTMAGWYVLDVINYYRYSSRKDKTVKDKKY